MLRVVVMTSDKHLPAVSIFAGLVSHYWGNPYVDVVGFKEPSFWLPSNFHFVSMGDQGAYPIDRWSDALIKYLHSIKDTHVILMLEDYFINAPVAVREIELLCHHAWENRDRIARIDLTTDRRYARGATDVGYCHHIPLIKSDPQSHYHLSLMSGIWNKKVLLQVLVPHESPWDVELAGTLRLARMPYDVLGTKSWNPEDERLAPMQYVLGIRYTETENLLLDGLPDGIRDRIIERWRQLVTAPDGRSWHVV